MNTNLSGSFHVHLHERADSRARAHRPRPVQRQHSPSHSLGCLEDGRGSRLPPRPPLPTGAFRGRLAAATSTKTARARYDDPRGANWFILGSHLIGQGRVRVCFGRVSRASHSRPARVLRVEQTVNPFGCFHSPNSLVSLRSAGRGERLNCAARFVCPDLRALISARLSSRYRRPSCLPNEMMFV